MGGEGRPTPKVVTKKSGRVPRPSMRGKSQKDARAAPRVDLSEGTNKKSEEIQRLHFKGTRRIILVKKTVTRREMGKKKRKKKKEPMSQDIMFYQHWVELTNE